MKTGKIKISDLEEFDVADYLTSEEMISEYLTVVKENGDPEALREALDDVARARSRMK